MGVVWKAEDVILGRKVAVKILPADVSRDESRRTMFLEEARAASAASHAHVVQVYEFGHEGDLDFIVMEYVEGNPLGKILVGRPLPPEKVAQLGLQIARALQAVHRRGLLHRDLKPSNVLVTPDGEVKVVDFGLSALFGGRGAGSHDDPTVTHVDAPASAPAAAGTVPYMSPEQVRGEPLDARSDVFSLGTVLYEMATGQRPFAGPTPTDTARAVMAASPVPVHDLVPSIPLDLERIIQKALSRKREDRYQTMDDFAVDLKRLDRDLESGSAPSYEALRGAFPSEPSAPSSVAPAPTRRWGRTAAAIAAIVLVAAVALVAWVGRGASSDPKTLLVLPFGMRGGSAAEAYLGQALAEAIAVNLAQIGDLRVLPVPEGGAARGTDATSKARAVGAGRVLTGSITREAETLHLNLELLDTRDGRLVGGIARDEARPDLTVLAAGLANDLADRLRLTARTAYEYPLYLRGDPGMVASQDAVDCVTAWRRGDGKAALDAAQRLARAYPREIGALALRAFLVDQGVDFGRSTDAERAAVFAELDGFDPRNPYVPVLRSRGFEKEGRSADEARRTLGEIAARDDLTPGCRAWALRTRALIRMKALPYAPWLDCATSPTAARNGGLDAELADFRKAVALDPASTWGHLYLSWALHLTGSANTAIEQARQAAALQPEHPLPRYALGAYLSAKGDWDGAVRVLSPAPERASDELLALLAVTLAHGGRASEAKAAIAAIPDADRSGAECLFASARLAALAGNRKSAADLAAEAVAAGFPKERVEVEPDLK